MFSFISEVFGAIKAAFGFASARSDLKNTADQRANAEAAQIQADKDKAAADIANKDQTALIKDVAP